MLVFLHVPKTAGTTLRSIIMRQYPSAAGFDTFGNPDAQPDLSAGMLHGHIHYGTVPGARYFTMLRDPIARIVSLYNHARYKPASNLHDEAMSRTLPDFVDLAGNDGQTRQIAGVIKGPIGPDELELAKRNLDSCVVVGIQEHFDESLLLFSKRLGWRFPLYRSKMVSHQSTDVAPEIRELIASRNQNDMALYAHAKELFDSYPRGALFGAQLTALRILNRGLWYIKRGKS